MKHYTQLTHEQRYQIHACMKAGWDQTEIATEIGVHKSTVSRELRRNRGARGLPAEAGTRRGHGAARGQGQHQALAARLDTHRATAPSCLPPGAGERTARDGKRDRRQPRVDSE
jgi:IS30 family transposase